MKPSRPVQFLLIAAALAAAACSTKSPTEPGSSVPIGPKVPPPVTTFNITVTASPSHLTIGSTTGSKITVLAANAQDGTPPPNLTPVTLTTTLGEFNSVGSGTQSVNLQLVGGRAQAVLFPGTSAGTATVGATSACGASGAPAVCPSPSVFTPGATTVVIGSPGTFFVNSLSPNTGDPAGGLVVTISGGGFQAPVAVTFGSSSAPVKSVSPNAIQVITPPSASPVPVGSTLQVSVTVTNNIGGTLAGTATLTNAFTYVPGGGGIQQPQVFSVTPASGTNDGGTQVTIIGQGFVAPVQVFFGSGAASSFNGIEATIQSVTATQIIVISPPARGFGQDNTNQLVSLLVKNTGSGFATIDAAAFKYGSKVIVTSAGPTTTVFNQPVKVTIFGQGFADPVAVSLAGIAAQVLSTSGTEIQVLSGIPAVSTCSNITGPVHVTNINNGDSADGPTFVYLVPKPEVFNITPGSGGQNGGTNLTITGSFADPGADQVLLGQQAAFPTPGRTSTTSTLFVTTPQFSGTFPTQPCIGVGGLTGTMNIGASVSVTVNDAVTSCTTTIQGAFTFEPNDTTCHVTPTPPQAAFTITTIHASNKVILNNTSSGGVPPLTYLWDFGGATDIGTTSTMKNPAPTYTAAGTYLITLTVTDAIGQTSSVGQTVTVPGA
ncbi:MAG TPA: IPT/TIG domain-containing protein [Thermoanaerobaculia bacterium]|nr:IPT/TIG domain-containing protein [Thermoanaerobaculia bacterium]